MKSLNHPHIIMFKEFVETPMYFIIVMDLMEGGDLFDRVIAEVSSPIFFFFFFLISIYFQSLSSCRKPSSKRMPDR